jgi:hypothetical protein
MPLSGFPPSVSVTATHTGILGCVVVSVELVEVNPIIDQGHLSTISQITRDDLFVSFFGSLTRILGGGRFSGGWFSNPVSWSPFNASRNFTIASIHASERGFSNCSPRSGSRSLVALTTAPRDKDLDVTWTLPFVLSSIEVRNLRIMASLRAVFSKPLTILSLLSQYMWLRHVPDMREG